MALMTKLKVLLLIFSGIVGCSNLTWSDEVDGEILITENICRTHFMNESTKYLSKSFLEFAENLTSLDAINCGIRKIEPLDFSQATELEIIDLSANKLTRILRETFQGAKSLEILNLSNNRIGFVSSRAFTESINLVSIDLSRNNLLTMRDLKLPQKLKKFNVQFNKK